MTDDQAQMMDTFHKGQTEGLHAVMRDNMDLQKEIADLRIQLALTRNGTAAEQAKIMAALESASHECRTPMFCVILECKCGDSISTAGHTLEAARGLIAQLGLAKCWDVENGEIVCLGCRE